MAALDVSTYSLPDLAEIRDLIEAEIARRHVLADADMAQQELNNKVAAAKGVVDGAEWVQPQTPAEAYPRGWTVERDGKRYRSKIPGNVWIPGNAADPQSGRWWEPVDVPAAGDDGVPLWQPWIPVVAGAVYSYGNGRWEVVQSHTTQPDWTPAAVPSLWKKLP